MVYRHNPAPPYMVERFVHHIINNDVETLPIDTLGTYRHGVVDIEVKQGYGELWNWRASIKEHYYQFVHLDAPAGRQSPSISLYVTVMNDVAAAHPYIIDTDFLDNAPALSNQLQHIATRFLGHWTGIVKYIRNRDYDIPRRYAWIMRDFGDEITPLWEYLSQKLGNDTVSEFLDFIDTVDL